MPSLDDYPRVASGKVRDLHVVDGDALVLGDEVLTPTRPDTGPQWLRAGHGAARFRQAVRPGVAHRALGPRLRHAAAPLPADVVNATRERYITAYERISGRSFADWSR